jgi:predicted PurR-regulated permease PerM
MLEKKIIKSVFFVVIVCGVLGFAYYIRDMMMPFILAALFTFVLSPYITRLQSYGLKRSVSVCVLFALFLFLFVGSIMMTLPKVIDELSVLNNNFPEQLKKFQVVAVDYQVNLEKKYPILKQKAVIDTALNKLDGFAQDKILATPSLLMDALEFISMLVLIPIILFFMLLSGKAILERFIGAMPSEYTETALGLIFEVEEILGKFIRSQVIECIIVGALSIFGYLILGIDYAVILGLIMGLSNLVPYVGPAISIIPVIIIGFMKFGTISIVVSVLTVFVIIRFLDDNIIKTIVMKKTVNVGPVLMIFSLMVGAKLYGMVGMVLAVPFAAIIKTIVQVVLGKHHITSDV